jgi:glycopeptide antibiotics resistance protein
MMGGCPALNVTELLRTVWKSFFSGGSNGSLLSLPEAIVFSLILFLVCLALFFRRLIAGKKFAVALLFLYAGALFALTVPILPKERWHMLPAATEWVLHSIVWVPFLSAPDLINSAFVGGKWSELLWILVGNVLIFMPFGILIPIIKPKIRGWHMIFISLLIPLLIESLQLVDNILCGSEICAVRTEDVILNAVGCLLGFLVFKLFAVIFRPRYRPRHSI